MVVEHRLTTFIRTKHVFKHRLKHLKEYDSVKIYSYELSNLNCNKPELLESLRKKGEIWFDNKGNYRAIIDGPIDTTLLKYAKKQDRSVSTKLSSLHTWMRDILMRVTLQSIKKEDMPIYFKAFLSERAKDIESFFSVDSFSKRVHTPIVNLKGDYRKALRLDGKRLTSLDVKQMQPLILAKVLEDNVGKNTFSDAIFNGKDVYVHIQKKAGLRERKDAKKYFFELVFGYPKSNIASMFNGDTAWVQWINDYKTNLEPNNPHGRMKPHTNLAWLLQYSEVQIMTGIWEKLKELDIPFLSIHDELLCKVSDREQCKKIMEDELKKHFRTFEVQIDH